MPGTFQVTATWDKASYVTGETMKATISGNYVTEGTEDTTTTVGPFDIPVTSESGAQSTISVPAVVVTTHGQPGSTEAVVIDSPAGSQLTIGGHTWTVSTDRKSITAVA